jgi:hypothetical protein
MITPQQADHFAKIWHWYPEKLTPFSSNWWFFLLSPEQVDGYGPKQMMFALVSRVGETVSINHLPHPGLKKHNQSGGVEDPFNSIALGWIHDGQQMHDGLVAQPAAAQLQAGQSIRVWANNGCGGEIMVANGRPFANKAYFRGQHGEARFETWGDPSNFVSVPEMIERQTVVGGANVIAWRKLDFAGEFTSPSGTETLSGIGYFQRVCLNIAPFPWKWMWVAFQDGSVFSCFLPYVGAHFFRHDDWFFPDWLENMTRPLYANAYFHCNRTGKINTFLQQRVTVQTPRRRGTRYPQFHVHCHSDNGDHFSFTANPYAHTQFLLDRQLVGPVSSRFNYNEYLFGVADLAGSVAGETINEATIGKGYGNCEYTWGLGL